tara:strand:- start:154 stop:369 length:216 start_codon:yes stop_codon:yes gene_type:complete
MMALSKIGNCARGSDTEIIAILCRDIDYQKILIMELEFEDLDVLDEEAKSVRDDNNELYRKIAQWRERDTQ